MHQLSEQMNAVSYNTFNHDDPSSVLGLNQVQTPRPRSHQVLVKVHYAALNPADLKAVQGYLNNPFVKMRKNPGFDFAGVVVAVGRKADQSWVGKRVHGMTPFNHSGSLADYLAVDAACVAEMREDQSFKSAAAIPLVAQTSNVIAPKVTQGSNVLILGGGTSTGKMAIQIAKAHGAANIVVTCSERSWTRAREFGATHHVDYRKGNQWEQLTGLGMQFNVIYDTCGGVEAVEQAADGLLARSGSFITIIGDEVLHLPLVS